MSSIEALKLLNDAELNASLTGAPGMSDSFTALIDSIVKRREGAVATKLESITNLKAGIDHDTTQAKYDNLNTLYDNYSAVVKRDYIRVIKLYENLVKVVGDTVRAAPSGIVKDINTANDKNIFVAAAAGEAKFFGGTKDPTKLRERMKIFKEKIIELVEVVGRTGEELANLELDRDERMNLRTVSRDNISPPIVPPAVADPHAQMIIDTREKLAEREDEFLEKIVKHTFATGKVWNVLITQFEALEHKVDEGKTLWLNISALISDIGNHMFIVAIAERDFLHAQAKKPLSGPTMRGIRELFNLLHDYESKAFDALHKHTRPADTQLGVAFEAYYNRASSAIGAGLFAADATIGATFSAEMTEHSPRRIEAELEAGI